MTIKELDKSGGTAWNNFVRNNDAGSFFHLAEWKDVLEKAFGLQTFYFYQEQDGAVIGVLPLALVKRPVFGPALVSNPLCVYGGGLGDCSALELQAIDKAKELGVQYLELRGGEDSELWQTSDRFYTFRRGLSQDHEENLNAIPRKQRAEVRKAIKFNLETQVNQDVDVFYRIYSQSVRNLGTPVFSKKYLKVLIDIFGDDCDVTTVLHAGKPLTSVVSFYYKGQVLPYYGGGLYDARHYSAYPYMYWKVMENAVNKDVQMFDFGRSMAGSGAYAFKKNFGFEPEPLLYRYHLVKAEDVPNIDPDSPRNKLITSVWKKMPLPVANKIGPILYPVIM